MRGMPPPAFNRRDPFFARREMLALLRAFEDRRAVSLSLSDAEAKLDDGAPEPGV